MDRKGQIWTFDMIAGATLFMIVIVAYFIFIGNISGFDKVNLDDMYSEGSIVSDTLVSAGYPKNWDISNVNQTGITDGNHRINLTKLKYVENISISNYLSLKIMLKTKYDYMFFFQDRKNEVMNLTGNREYIGKEGITKDNLKSIEYPENLISIKRLLINGTDIITMVLYLWD